MKTFSSIIKRAKAFALYLGKPEDKTLIQWYVEKALIAKSGPATFEPPTVGKAGLTTPELIVWWKKDGHFNKGLYERICEIKRTEVCY